jgi:hypothetical protein
MRTARAPVELAFGRLASLGRSAVPAAGDEDGAASAMATHMATASQRLAAEATS